MGRPKIPRERYEQDVQGMPVFAATRELTVVVSDDDMHQAIAADDEHCALAIACKRQFTSPYVSIGRSRSDIAMPHPQGVIKPGHGETLWAVIRFKNSRKAKDIIIAVDTDSGEAAGATVSFQPQKSSLLPEAKRERNKRFRENKGTRVGTRSGQRKGVVDHLTILGVRNLNSGRRVLSEVDA